MVTASIEKTKQLVEKTEKKQKSVCLPLPHINRMGFFYARNLYFSMSQF